MRGLVTVIAFFALAPAAQAWPTLEARFRTVTVAPVLISASETTRDGGVGSGVNQTPAGLPVLVAPPYAAMRLAFSQPAESVTANFGGETVAATRELDGAFTLVLPNYAAPADVRFVVAYSTAEVTGRAEYVLELSSSPPYVSRLQLRGSRLRAKVRCIGTCTGSITLRTLGRRIVARIELTGSGWMSTRLDRAQRRRVEKLARLRVRTRAAGAPLQRETLTLER